MNEIPDITIPSSLDLVAQESHRCVNGVILHTLSTTCAAVVRLSLVFEGGSSSQTAPFAACSTLSMLSEGSDEWSAQQIAEKLDFYGIYLDTSTDRDYCYITVAALSRFLGEALTLLEQIVLHPAFAQQEFELYRDKFRQQIILDRQKPSYIARESFVSALFGNEHPYGRFSPTEAIDSLSVSDLRRYRDENLVASRLFAVASGDLSNEHISQIMSLLERIPTHAPAPLPQFAKASIAPGSRRDIERPAATQSCLRMGKLLMTKSHPHYIEMQLLLTVLGGYFGSRLVQNLREKHGYTYSIYSDVVAMRHEGYMAIATDVAMEHTQDAIAQINVELERLRTTMVAAEELQMAKNTIAGELMRLIDGPFGIADIAIENVQSGLPPTYVNDFLGQINATTPERLLELAKEYLDPTTMTVIVVR